MEHLEIKAAIQIQRPVQEVYEAIVDPEKIKNYFISESNGRLEKGKELTWKFPEFDGEVLIEVKNMVPNELVSFVWEGAKAKKLQVDMVLHTMPDDSTVVKITEGKMINDKTGIEWFGGNTEGWANFLACLKAYLEYGINLRKGAFEFRRGEI